MSYIKISELPAISSVDLNGTEDIMITKNDESKRLKLTSLSDYLVSDIENEIDNINLTLNNVATKTELSTKVDKIPGKGLSAQDYTTTDKLKLDGIENNANKYVLPVGSSTILGGVRSSATINIAPDGVISVSPDISADWSNITSKPITLAGYGLTDVYTTTEVDLLLSDKADLNSPSFTGTPLSTTAAIGTNNTQIATTAFVNAEIQNDSSNLNTANLLVRRDGSGNFSAGTITAALTGNASTSTNLSSNRTFALTGDVTGSVSSNLSSGMTITTTVADNSHNHTVANVTGIQTVLDAKVNNSEKGVANGIATLDSNGKVPLSQISDSILGQLEYQGIWDFTTIPIATEKGQYWVTSVAGNGYNVGDWAVYNGISFDKVDNTDSVASVAGKTGNVVLTKADVNLSNAEDTADSTKNVLSATKWTTARTITIGSTGKSLDGSANITWSLAEIGAQAAGSYQAADADLTSIAGLAGATGLLRKTAANTWSLDTNDYVTSSGVTLVGGTLPIVSSGGNTPTISINAATTSASGSMSASDKTKLDGIATGAQVNVGTDLSLGTATATVLPLNSSTGTDVILPAATTTTAGLLISTDKSKLDGIATGANNYVHPTTDGSLHVPATSTTNNGKVLMAGATAGSISWQTISTDHTILSNIGTNTHAQIDTNLTRLANTSGTNTGDNAVNTNYASDYRAANFIAGTNYQTPIGTITGIVKGNGANSLTSATVRVDYAEPTTALATGILKNTTTTGVHSIAVAGTDYLLPNGSAADLTSFPILNQNTTGSAATLSTGRTISMTGDVTWTSASFNGSANVTGTSTLKNTGTAGTYRSITTDSQGRVTAGTNPTTVSGYGLTDVYTKTESNTSLSLKVNNSEKGVANGLATLDVNGKVVLTQIPDSVLGQLEYMGTWDFTVLPTATQKGQYWIASVSGNGYEVGDWAVWNGTAFDKVDNTDAVVTVAGRTGNVVLTKTDVGLANVDNTSDANKPVSTAQQTALNLKANLASPVFTGNVTGLGVATGTSFNSITGLSSSLPVMAGTAAIGTSTTAARADHIHPAQTNINGNSGTATKLATARTINGVAFDGTANITISTGAANILTTEYLNGNSRNGLPIYGIEVNIGSMPNSTFKNVAFTFNAAYTYWIDASNSYCSNSTAGYPLNYTGNVGESISCYLDRTNNLIKVLASDDKSGFTGKIVILYTK